MISVEWDEEKRRANLAKHGLDFFDVPAMDWDRAVIIPDERFAYPEPRFWAFARLRDVFMWSHSAFADQRCV